MYIASSSALPACQSTPTLGKVLGRCACAASGELTANPPSSVMKSRRFIVRCRCSMRQPKAHVATPASTQMLKRVSHFVDRQSSRQPVNAKPLILYRRPSASIRSGHVVVHPAAAVRPIQKVVAVAQSSFGVLIDRDHDRLDVLIAVALERVGINLGVFYPVTGLLVDLI